MAAPNTMLFLGFEGAAGFLNRTGCQARQRCPADRPPFLEVRASQPGRAGRAAKKQWAAIEIWLAG